MFKLLKNFKPSEWGIVALSFVLVVAQVFLDLRIPDFMARITELIKSESSLGHIFVQGGYMMICALSSLVLSVVVCYFASKLSSKFASELRLQLFQKVGDFSSSEINGFSTSSLITRSTNDVTQVQMIIVVGMQIIFKAPVMAIIAITKIVGKGFAWTAVTLGAVCLLLVMIAIIMTVALPRFKKMQGLIDNVNRVARENLTGIRVVRAYNAERFEEKKFEVESESLKRNQLVTMRTMGMVMPFMTLIMNGLSLAIYYVGAVLINNAGAVDKLGLFSNMVVFSSYAMQVVMSFMMLSMIMIMLPRALVSAKRIDEVLSKEVSIKDGKGAFESEEGTVEFRNVYFAYGEGDYVLEDISFKANKGETVAFIGSTGSGKTSIVNLIPRLFEATEGEVLFCGDNVKNYNLEKLRSRIGYATQKATLFSGTVESNVTYGLDSVNKEDMDLAIEISQSKDFVGKMEEGVNSRISQGGTNVSGGQKQRLSIARAIVGKKDVLIFDDTFSALDYATDKKLRQELKAKTDGVTTLIVSQRISTIKDADKIIVLHEGKIVGMGTHKELLQSNEVYNEIALSQLSKEEIANG